MTLLFRLREQYRKMSLPVRMSLWYMACSVLQKGISMMTTPIFTRVMTASEYGRYSIFQSWSGILGAVISLNIAGGYYMRSLIQKDGDREVLTTSMIGLTGLLCLLALGICFLFPDTVSRVTGLNGFLMVCLIALVFFNNIHFFWTNRKRADYQYRPIVASSVFVTVLGPLLSVILVGVSDPSHQVEGRIIGTVLVDAALCLILLFSVFRTQHRLFHWEYWKNALIFSLPLVPHYLSKLVLSQADRLMIKSCCGLSEAAYYSVAHSLAAVVLIINQSVATSLDPWLYRCIQKNSVRDIKRVSFRILLLMAGLNLCVIAVAPELLRFFAPEAYYSAVWAIPPVTASVFFMFASDLFTAFQYYFCKTQWIMYASIAGALLNIVLNMICIPLFGFVAAGYTTLLCYILFAWAHYGFLCKVCDTYMDGARPYAIRGILLVGLLLLVLGGCVTALYPHPVIRYLILGTGVLGILFKFKSILSVFRSMKK